MDEVNGVWGMEAQTMIWRWWREERETLVVEKGLDGWWLAVTEMRRKAKILEGR